MQCSCRSTVIYSWQTSKRYIEAEVHHSACGHTLKQQPADNTATMLHSIEAPVTVWKPRLKP